MKGYYKLVIAVLEQHGYLLLRPGKGAHEIWHKGQRRVTVSVNMPSRHTANAIMKQARIKHRF